MIRGTRFVGLAVLAVWSTAAAITQPRGLTLTSPAFKHNTPVERRDP